MRRHLQLAGRVGFAGAEDLGGDALTSDTPAREAGAKVLQERTRPAKIKIRVPTNAKAL
jgi:hypothetical protein